MEKEDYSPFVPKRAPIASFFRRYFFWILTSIIIIILVLIGLVVGMVFGLGGDAHRHHHVASPSPTQADTGTATPSSTSTSTSTPTPTSNPHGQSSSSVDWTVDLGYSKYKGAPGSSGISQWLGIRYAAAPVGNLRFRSPQDPPTDNKLYQANTHGAVCHSSPSSKLDTAKSEDCLFLDVYAPTNNTASHPVFVYFQGGGFNSLSAPNLNGSSLINAGDHDLVVVTFNYRVGPYGFLASKEVQSNGDLNVGLLDQRKVLYWVQKYIHLFGGDPSRVTIGGASAGGASVDLHMTAYGGRNDSLFHAAAAESQSFGLQLTVEQSQYQYDALVNRVACKSTADSLACLRNLDISVLATSNINIPTPEGSGGTPVFMYSATLDGNFSKDFSYTAFAKGEFVKVPAIFGDATNEGTIFTPGGINTITQFHSFLKNNFPNLTTSDLTQIDQFYPQAEQFPNKGAYWRTAANAYGDMRYICPGINISTAVSTRSPDQSWNYHWDYLPSSDAASGLGVTHTAESGSIWGSSGNAFSPPIQAYWTSFIRTGNPNTYKLSSAPTWGSFSESKMQRLRFGDGSEGAGVGMEDVPADQVARCEFLSKLGPRIQQ